MNGYTWYSAASFNVIGPFAVGLALLAFFLGAAIGLALRRTVLAMGVALVAVEVVKHLLGRLLPHLMPSLYVSWSVTRYWTACFA